MKNLLKMSNLIPLILLVYISKSFIVTPTPFDFGIAALMSLSFLYKLKLDKDVLSDKDELKAIIAQFEEKVNEKIDKVQKSQDSDRLAAESKFSTLNLGLQRSGKASQEKATYGWGSR